jgi:two-component system nitrogen regulation response regulator GlnG/two-component system response regulator HydG
VVLATSADPALLAPALRARLACLVEVPPLDARREDVPLLLAHHARLLGPADNAAPVPGPRLVEALLRHPLDQGARWLQTVVARSSEGSRPGTLELTPAVEKLLGAEPLSPLAPAPGEAELAQAMARAGGNLTNAARMLGLRNRYALSHRLRERGALPRLV